MLLGDALAAELVGAARLERTATIDAALAAGIAICPDCLKPHPRVGRKRWSMTPRCIACSEVLMIPPWFPEAA